MSLLSPEELDAQTLGGVSSTTKVMQLTANGYGWLGNQALFALANSGLNDNDVQYTLDNMTRAAVNSDKANAAQAQIKQQGGVSYSGFSNIAAIQKQQVKAATTTSFGFKQFFADPVLQKAPSVGLALKQYLSGAIGPWPIAQSDNVAQQHQLQARGYGRDLPADGTWGQEWNAAYSDYSHALYQEHLSGDKAGSISLGKALQGLSALQPTSAFDALWGFAKALPGEGRDLLARLAGGIVGLGAGQYNLLTGADGRSWAQGARAGAGVTSDIESALGHPTTSEQILHQTPRELFANFVQDASTIFLLTGAMGAGGRIYNAIGAESRVADAGLGTALGAQEATKGPGIIAHLLGSPELGTEYAPGTRLSRAAVGGVLGGATVTASGSDNPGEVLAGIAGGAALGALSYKTLGPGPVARLSQAFDNIPVLGNTGPVIDRLATAGAEGQAGLDGLYYRTRSLLATPYKYMPVRAAGNAFQQASLLGAETRGLAALQSQINPDGTEMSRAVQGEHLFDAVNDAVKFRLPFINYDVGLNDLQFFLHGPTTDFIHGTGATDKAGNVITKGVPVPGRKLSQAVAAQTNNLISLYQDRLHQIGVIGIAEKVTGEKWNKIVKDYGGIEKASDFWYNNVADHAAWLVTEDQHTRQLMDAGIPAEEARALANEDSAKAMADAWSALRADPTRTADTIKTALAQGRGAQTQELISRIRRETANSYAGARKYQNAGHYMDAVYHARTDLAPYFDKYIGDGTATGDRMLVGANEISTNNGLATLDHWSRQQAYAEASRLENEYHLRQSAGTSLEEMNSWNAKVDHVLRYQFGINGTQIPESGLDKVQLIRDKAEHLSTDITVNPDAPQVVKDAMTKLNGMGYKLVNGNGIGNIVSNAPTPVDMMSGALTIQRRIAETLGLTPELIPGHAVYLERGTNIINEFGKEITAGRAVMHSPSIGPNELFSMMNTPDFVNTTAFPDRLRQGIARITNAAKRTSERTGIPIEDLEREMSRTLLPPDMNRGKFVKAFSTSEGLHESFPNIASELNGRLTPEQMEINMALYGSPEASITDRAGAEALYQAMVRGASKTPTSMLGAQHIEELWRSGFGLAGKVTPNNQLGWAVANLPNKLIQLRNEFRFELDPWFSIRRWLKTNVKMSAEGVTPVMNPAATLDKAGIRSEASETLARVMPEALSRITDQADYVLKSHDIFNLYKMQDSMAWGAWNWEKQGLSDPEIRDKLIRTFEYGTDGVAGRSALERTANFTFFPFSFEKTVVRNLGGYLLDHPAQRVLLTKALAAYDDFNKNHAGNPLSVEFMKAHAPILKEAADLNMFAHGLSLGQPGGINRPLINLFLPQSWDASHPDFITKLQAFAPAVQKFSTLVSQLGEQGTIMTHAMNNLFDDVKGTNGTLAWGGKWDSAGPRESTLTPAAQNDAAFALQREVFANYATIIDANAKTRDPDKKINFEMDPRWGRYAGEPITKANLRQIIHDKYPAYDPNAAVMAATTNSANFTQYLLGLKGKPLYDDVALFADYAHKLGNAMNAKRGTTEQIASLTSWLRTKAIYLAENDPKFLALYDKSFRRTLGPIEKVT